MCTFNNVSHKCSNMLDRIKCANYWDTSDIKNMQMVFANPKYEVSVVPFDFRCWDVKNVNPPEQFATGEFDHTLFACDRPFFGGIIPAECNPKQCGCKDKSVWIGTRCACDKANGYRLMIYPGGVMTCECDEWDKNLVADANGDCVCKDRYVRNGDRCDLLPSMATPSELEEAYNKLKCPDGPSSNNSNTSSASANTSSAVSSSPTESPSRYNFSSTQERPEGYYTFKPITKEDLQRVFKCYEQLHSGRGDDFDCCNDNRFEELGLSPNCVENLQNPHLWDTAALKICLGLPRHILILTCDVGM